MKYVINLFTLWKVQITIYSYCTNAWKLMVSINDWSEGEKVIPMYFMCTEELQDKLNIFYPLCLSSKLHK